jgi:membrane-bound lytic murein transglycosylase A
VTTDVTVATNKAIFPPAAAMLVQTTVQDGNGRTRSYVALRLDQDTGGAMRAPGRADLYMGVGEESERRAGVQEYEGRMWYLILK